MTEREIRLSIHRQDLGFPYLVATRVVTPCQACNGKGVEHFKVGDYDYARECPTCKRIDGIIKRFEDARLPPDAIDARLDCWVPNGQRPNPAGLREYINGFAPGAASRCLMGPPGVGKSWMMDCVCHELILRGFRVRRVGWRHLLDSLINCYQEKKSDAPIVDPLLAVDVCAIDDLGAAQDTDYARRVAERVIGDRITASQTVIFTSNLYLEQDTPEHGTSLREYVGDRVWSRIHGFTTFNKLTGEDMRPRSNELRKRFGG